MNMNIESVANSLAAGNVEKEPIEPAADNILSQPRSTLEHIAQLEGEEWREEQVDGTKAAFGEFTDNTGAEMAAWPDEKLKALPVKPNSFLGGLKLLEMVRRANKKTAGFKPARMIDANRMTDPKTPYFVIFGKEERKWGVSSNGKIMFLREGSTGGQREEAKKLGFKVY